MMHILDKPWTDGWYRMNMFNLSSSEANRRKTMNGIYKIFSKVVEDANAFDVSDNFSSDEYNGYYTMKSCEVIWQKIMFCVKKRWPSGFFAPKNSKVVAIRCNLCNDLLEYHVE